jgi:cilia- and flagella-associated protein 52
LIREIEASKSGPINSIDIFLTGDYFVTGGSHQQVNLWNYKRGEINCVGIGHAGAVTTVKISPCGKFMVSGGADGAVFMWRVPQVSFISSLPAKENK